MGRHRHEVRLRGHGVLEALREFVLLLECTLERGVGLQKLPLLLLELARHVLKRPGKLSDLIGPVTLNADDALALGDLGCGISQLADGLHDHPEHRPPAPHRNNYHRDGKDERRHAEGLVHGLFESFWLELDGDACHLESLDLHRHGNNLRLRERGDRAALRCHDLIARASLLGLGDHDARRIPDLDALDGVLTRCRHQALQLCLDPVGILVRDHGNKGGSDDGRSILETAPTLVRRVAQRGR